MDYVDDLGRAGLSSRLKRLSDTLFSEIGALHRAQGIQLEASCFPLLGIVERFGPLSLREAEEKLGTSHAAVSQKASVLSKAGLIELQIFKGDQRIKKMVLTEDGRALIARARPIWQATDRALAEIFYPDENVFFRLLKTFEDRLEARPLKSAVEKQLAAPLLENLKIVDFGIGMKHHFRRLNEEWIDRHFRLTEAEEDMYENPRKAILDRGGDILLAEADGEVVGVCALLPEGKRLEFVRMGIDPRFRGRGVGNFLLEAAIARARAKSGFTVLYLYGNTRLPRALDACRALGFKDVPMVPIDDVRYGRLDVRMELRLGEATA